VQLLGLFFFVGYDQPGDGYTGKYAKIKVDVLHPYQPDILTSQQDNGQQPYPFQQSYRHDTDTKVVNIGVSYNFNKYCLK
jgi:hypothetical protein